MKMSAVLCATLSGPAMAEVISCDLSGVAVQFEIDRAQFAPAIDNQEPVRRRVTTVYMADAQFLAEPIMIGDVRGFWAERTDGSDMMFVTHPDGSAFFADSRTGSVTTGTCVVLQ